MARVCHLTDNLKYGKETWGELAGKRRKVYICSHDTLCVRKPVRERGGSLGQHG